jgi:hypothetical protein
MNLKRALVAPADEFVTSQQRGEMRAVQRSVCPRAPTSTGAHLNFCLDSDVMDDTSGGLLVFLVPQLKRSSVVEVHGFASCSTAIGARSAVPFSASLSGRHNRPA